MSHLYIRHTVGGRLFLDSILHNLDYNLVEVNNHWMFTIDLADESIAEQILHNQNELNIFIVSEGEISQKSWFYSQRGEVEYDKEKQKLVILADHRLDYPV